MSVQNEGSDKLENQIISDSACWEARFRATLWRFRLKTEGCYKSECFINAKYLWVSVLVVLHFQTMANKLVQLQWRAHLSMVNAKHPLQKKLTSLLLINSEATFGHNINTEPGLGFGISFLFCHRIGKKKSKQLDFPKQLATIHTMWLHIRTDKRYIIIIFRKLEANGLAAATFDEKVHCHCMCMYVCIVAVSVHVDSLPFFWEINKWIHNCIIK